MQLVSLGKSEISFKLLSAVCARLTQHATKANLSVHRVVAIFFISWTFYCYMLSRINNAIVHMQSWFHFHVWYLKFFFVDFILSTLRVKFDLTYSCYKPTYMKKPIVTKSVGDFVTHMDCTTLILHHNFCETPIFCNKITLKPSWMH